MSSPQAKPAGSERSVTPLIIGVLFSTYFLTVQTIELSLSTYVLKENQWEFYRSYLRFKSDGHIWNWWHLFSSLTIPLSVITAIADLVRILTTKDTLQHHLMNVIKAAQLFTTLFIVLTRVMPLEKKITELSSKALIVELHFYQQLVFVLNIIGWFIPIILFDQMKNEGQLTDKDKKKKQ